jgi:polyferredoxin
LRKNRKKREQKLRKNKKKREQRRKSRGVRLIFCIFMFFNTFPYTSLYTMIFPPITIDLTPLFNYQLLTNSTANYLITKSHGLHVFHIQHMLQFFA